MGIVTPYSDENEGKINLEEAKFIFQQADTKLKDTVETSQIIVGRTVTIAGISIGIMVALVSYLFTKWSDSNSNFYSLLVVKIAACYYFLLNIVIVLNIHPSKYTIAGSNPSQLYGDHFFKAEHDNTIENPNNRLLELYKVTIGGYESGINNNKNLNNSRWKLFRFSLWALALSPLFIIFVYILFIIIR